MNRVLLLAALLLVKVDCVTLRLTGQGSVDAKTSGTGSATLDITGSRRRLTEEEEAVQSERQLSGTKVIIDGTCRIFYAGDIPQTSLRSGLQAAISVSGGNRGAVSFNFRKPVADTDGTSFEKFTFQVDTSKLKRDFDLSLSFDALYDRAVREAGSQIFFIECDAKEVTARVPLCALCVPCLLLFGAYPLFHRLRDPDTHVLLRRRVLVLSSTSLAPYAKRKRVRKRSTTFNEVMLYVGCAYAGCTLRKCQAGADKPRR